MFPNDAGSEQVRSTVLRYVLRRSTSNVDTIFAAAAPGDVNPELVDASKQLQQTHDYEEQAAAFARMVAAADGAELQADGAECTTAMAGPLRAICRQRQWPTLRISLARMALV